MILWRLIDLQNVPRFKPEYITISLMVLVSIVLLLTLLSGRSSIKEAITLILIIGFLSSLTIDIKNNSIKTKSSTTAYKYGVLIFLFSCLSFF